MGPALDLVTLTCKNFGRSSSEQTTPWFLHTRIVNHTAFMMRYICQIACIVMKNAYNYKTRVFWPYARVSFH